MVVQDRLFTTQDLADMPDDGKIYELHNGVLIEMAGSKFQQTTLAAWIIYLLTAFVQENKLGGLVTGADGAAELNKYNTRIPDVGYLTAERVKEQKADSYIQGAPDLAIEVVSESNSAPAMQQRAGEYLAAKARLVWIVNAEKRTIDVYRADGTRSVLRGEDVLEGAEVLPGLALSVNRIFEQLQ